MTAYLDSSVLLRHILLGEEPIRQALALPRVASSELIEIECRRGALFSHDEGMNRCARSLGITAAGR